MALRCSNLNAGAGAVISARCYMKLTLQSISFQNDREAYLGSIVAPPKISGFMLTCYKTPRELKIADLTTSGSPNTCMVVVWLWWLMYGTVDTRRFFIFIFL